jgi:hypothetical protein
MTPARLFWAWALHAGLALFVAWWAHARGLWKALVEGDPSGLSLGIVALSVAVTAWCGRRAWRLMHEAEGGAWLAAWRSDLARGGSSATHAKEALAERTHGPHETAWWFCSAAIKLGLLGTVIGFVVMASEIGRMPSFDLADVQLLLRRMTQGMAIALTTTLAGLAANLWLGLPLLLLDRAADAVAAGILAGGEGPVPA